MKNLLLSALFLGVMLSCSNDDSPRENESSLILPINVNTKSDDSFGVNIKYNGNKILETIDDQGYKTIFKYDGNHIVKVSNYDLKGEEDMIQDYVYTNGKISSSVTKETSTSSTGIKNVYISNATYEWLDANHLKKTVKSESSSTVRTYEYFFSNGNMVKSIEQYGSGTSAGTYTETLTYDTKNNPLKNILGFEAVQDSDFAMNNIVTRERNSQNGSNTNYTDVYTYIYEYNANNYPTKGLKSIYTMAFQVQMKRLLSTPTTDNII